MKKWLANKAYQLLKDYIEVEWYKNPIRLTPRFEIRIFGHIVAAMEYTEREMIFRTV